MEKGRYYCAHLHMHSTAEGNASMGGHMYEAGRTGVEVIWFTDHDSRLGRKKRPVDGFDFEEESLLITNTTDDIEKRLTQKFKEVESFGVILDEQRYRESREILAESYKTFYGWKPLNFDNPAESELKLTSETAFTGKQCMKMTAASTDHDGSWQSMGVVFVSNGKRHQYPLLSFVTLKIACLAESMDKDTRIIFEVKMSQQPPDHSYARLRYVIGDTEGLSDDYISVIQLGAETGKWQQFVLDVSRDAEKYCTGRQDNVFSTISIMIQARNGKMLTCFFDNFEINSELVCDDLRERQQQMADQLGVKYGVISFAATEISSAGQHKISFCTKVPIINYYERSFKVSHMEAVEWVERHNGIFSLNHPFDSWKRVFINEEDRRNILDRISEEYISTRCSRASLIEIGFPEGRHNFNFEDYLELWDRLGSSGIFITGYGDSDNHSNSSNWWDGNNFAAWIYAEEPTEENFLLSMKNGNLFTGDPVLFKGQLSFKTLEGYSMGQVVRADKPEYGLVFEINSIKPDWIVKWVVNGTVRKSVKSIRDAYKGELFIEASQNVDFCRVEVYNEDGRCVVLTNPIYFVSSEDITIPKGRRAK